MTRRRFAGDRFDLQQFQQQIESDRAPDGPDGQLRVWRDTSVTPHEFYLVTSVKGDRVRTVYGLKLTNLREID
jgi:hypothetical protein